MNEFSRLKPETADMLPSFEDWMAQAPVPIWDGHDSEIKAHRHSWEFLYRKLHSPEEGSGFVRNYIYTPFGSSVFVWGSCFITMFAKYLSGVFPFIRQLDNFYALQEDDGFIARQIHIHDGKSEFAKDDPDSEGGDIFAWAEREWARYSGDKSRFPAVYPVLLAYHRWIRANRTRPDGTYVSSGWGCGMDNIPRFDTDKYNLVHDAADIGWIDATLQQIFDAKNLLAMAEEAGIEEGREELRKEVEELSAFVRDRMWNEKAGLYVDLTGDGKPSDIEHVGGFWAFLAGLADGERAKRLAETAEDPTRFAMITGTASLSAKHPEFDADGGGCYWQGGVWCITDYMLVKGLESVGLGDVAHRIARRHVQAVAKIHDETDTIWESYAPRAYAPGKCWGETVRKDFVGFSGVTPVSLFIENVLGIDATVERIVWNVRLTERHGIRNLHLADGTVVDLLCEARASADEKPVVTIHSSRPVKLDVKVG